MQILVPKYKNNVLADLLFSGRWYYQHHDADGNLVEEYSNRNTVTMEGINYILGSSLSNTAKIPQWYSGLLWWGSVPANIPNSALNITTTTDYAAILNAGTSYEVKLYTVGSQSGIDKYVYAASATVGQLDNAPALVAATGRAEWKVDNIASTLVVSNTTSPIVYRFKTINGESIPIGGGFICNSSNMTLTTGVKVLAVEYINAVSHQTRTYDNDSTLTARYELMGAAAP